jgi:diacylglycerol kinase (ATP)
MGAAVPAKIKVILNTHGGRLDPQAKIASIERGMAAAGAKYTLDLTEYANHACELAQQAALDGWPVVVAAGGDGTISEVVNGLMRAGDDKPAPTLGIIPLGSANDLADGLELPREVSAVCHRIMQGKTRPIDLGLVNGHYFANNSAVGLEPVVTQEQEQMRQLLHGTPRYVVAALRCIRKAKPWQVRMEWDQGAFEGPITLVSVGNGSRTGGAFYMTPQARLDDGLLDFVYAYGLSSWQILKLFPKTLTGKHIDHPLVKYQRTKFLSISIDPTSPLQADGEIISDNATDVNYQVIPNRLRVIV